MRPPWPIRPLGGDRANSGGQGCLYHSGVGGAHKIRRWKYLGGGDADPGARRAQGEEAPLRVAEGREASAGHGGWAALGTSLQGPGHGGQIPWSERRSGQEMRTRRQRGSCGLEGSVQALQERQPIPACRSG